MPDKDKYTPFTLRYTIAEISCIIHIYLSGN